MLELERVIVNDGGVKAFAVTDKRACGSAGCAKGLFMKAKQGWQKLFEAREFELLTTRTNGYVDLLAHESDYSSDLKRPNSIKYVWDGKQYSKRK